VGEVAFSSNGEFLFVSRGSMSVFPWPSLVELFRRGDDLPGVRIVSPALPGPEGDANP